MAVVCLLLEEQKAERNSPCLTNQEVSTSICLQDIREAVQILDGLFNFLRNALQLLALKYGVVKFYETEEFWKRDIERLIALALEHINKRANVAGGGTVYYRLVVFYGVAVVAFSHKGAVSTIELKHLGLRKYLQKFDI